MGEDSLVSPELSAEQYGQLTLMLTKRGPSNDQDIQASGADAQAESQICAHITFPALCKPSETSALWDGGTHTARHLEAANDHLMMPAELGAGRALVKGRGGACKCAAAILAFGDDEFHD